MITKELIEQNDALKELSEQQIAAICQLSENDERLSFGEKFGKIHSELDETIKEITGIGKDTNEKTSAYLRRMLEVGKSERTDLAAKVEALEKSRVELEEKVKGGSADKELLMQRDATIKNLQDKYSKLQEESKAARSEYERGMTEYKVKSDITAALNSLNYAEGQNMQMLTLAKEKAVAEVMSKNPSYITDNSGKEVLVFHTADGAEMRNEKNGLNLYTAAELLKEQLGVYGVLSDGVSGGGAGGGSSTPKGGDIILSAKSKSEALGIIESQLFGKGLSRNTLEFQQAMDAEYSKHADFLSSLPR